MKQKNSPHSLRRIIIVVSIVIALPFILLAAFLFWPTSYPATKADYPLGDKLEYLGAEHYGCRILCDSLPSSVLYYGTDMTPEGVVRYFKNTRLLYPVKQKSGFIDIALELQSSPDMVLFLDYKEHKATEEGLKQTTKKYSISLGYASYETALRALDK